MMDEGLEKKEGKEMESEGRQEIFSKAVRAGKRTYFFDVKSTRKNDYYLTVTESKKRFNKDGKFYYEKHKIFLYKEDFEKFLEGLTETIEFIKTSSPVIDDDLMQTEKVTEEDYTSVEFEDLEKAE